MSNTITRRAALTGTAAGAVAIVARTGPTRALEPHPVADLFALGREYDAIYAKINDAHDRIEIIAPSGPGPVVPEALKVQPGDEALGIPRLLSYGSYSWGEIQTLRETPRVRQYQGPIKLAKAEYHHVRELMGEAVDYVAARAEPWPEAQARADEIVAAFDTYEAERKWPDDASEAVVEIEKEIDNLHDELRPVAKGDCGHAGDDARRLARQGPSRPVALSGGPGRAHGRGERHRRRAFAVDHRRPLGDAGGPGSMIARRDVPLWWLLVRFKVKLWRYHATRAALRLVRRVCDRLEPNSHRSS